MKRFFSFLLVLITLSNILFVTPASAASDQVLNPSVEDVSANDNARPDHWFSSKAGSNNAVFSHDTIARTGQKSVLVNMSEYSSGDAKWYFEHIQAAPNTTYNFTDYYQSDVSTGVLVEYLSTAGKYSYVWIGDLTPSTEWKQASLTFKTPSNVASFSILHFINKNGYLRIDDVSVSSFTPPAPKKFARALVTITFDDGWRSIYNNAYPVMQQYGFRSTQYLTTSFLNKKSYMTNAMVSTMQQNGHEIAAHTVTHPSLPKVSSTQLYNELVNANDTLKTSYGVYPTNFATPYGEYNDSVLTAIKQQYYSHRTIEKGLNYADSMDQYRIKSYMLEVSTPVSQVKKWIDDAKATNSWLVLTYHEVKPNDQWTYNRKLSNFKSEMAYLKQSGVAVVTIEQALSELLPQL